MKKILIVTLLTMLLLTSCGAPRRDDAQSSSPQQNSESTPALEPTPEPTPTIEPTPEPTAEPQNQVGDTVTLGDWEITLVGCEITDQVSVNQFMGFTADEGNQYVLVTLSVKNTGTAADTFLPSFHMGDSVSAKLLYQEEYEFSATNMLGHSDELHDKKLNPLSSAEGLVAFQVATEAAVPEQLELVLSQGKKSVIYSLGNEAVSTTAMASVEPTPLPDQAPETSREAAEDSAEETKPSPSAEPTPAPAQDSEPSQDMESTPVVAQIPAAPEPVAPPAPEPVVQPEMQTAQNGENLPANFTEWVPYSTSDLQLLMQNIANGNVILYNGIYWASPTYANSIANEVVVYQHDISGDVEVRDRFDFADVDISGLYDENEGSESLTGIN